MTSIFFLEIHKFFEREMEQMFKEFDGIGGIMGQQKMLEDFPSRIEELPDAGSQTDRDLMLKSDSGKFYNFGFNSANLKKKRSFSHYFNQNVLCDDAQLVNQIEKLSLNNTVIIK